MHNRVCVKDKRVTQQKPQSSTASPGRDDEEDRIRVLKLTGRLTMETEVKEHEACLFICNSNIAYVPINTQDSIGYDLAVYIHKSDMISFK